MTDLTMHGTRDVLADRGMPPAIGEVRGVDYTFRARGGWHRAAKNEGGVTERLPAKGRVVLEDSHAQVTSMVVEV